MKKDATLLKLEKKLENNTQDEIVLSMGTLSFASKLVAVKKLELENHEIKNKE